MARGIKRNHRRKLLVVAIIVLIAIGIFIKEKGRLFQTGKDTSTTVASQSFENIPEMKDILGPDQETRLKGGRKLVERVDVEQALEILKNSPLPNTGEGHLVVHQVGFYAYKKYGVESILHCKDYFLYACYHGAIIEAASDQGFGVIAKMAEKCKDSPARYFQCLHASGHSILAIWDYDLPEALKTCDEVFKDDKYEDQASCHNGAFMENLFGVHDWGTGKAPVREWLSDDAYFPCNAFSDRYQRGCWLNQAARIYQLYNGDLVRTAQTCRDVGNDQYKDWCLDNLSRQIHAMTNNDISKVFSLCQTLGTDWRDKCIVVNAGSFYSVGGRQQAVQICQLVVPESKEACYQNILGQLFVDQIKAADKVAFCRQVEPQFSSQCFASAQVL